MNVLFLIIGIVMICILSIFLYAIKNGQKVKRISFRIKNIITIDAEMQKENEMDDVSSINHLKKQ